MQTDYIFRAEVTPDKKTFPEINTVIARSRLKYCLSPLILSACYGYYLYLLLQPVSMYTAIPYIGLAFTLLYMVPHIVSVIRNRDGGIHYQRALSNNNGIAPQVEYVFTQEHILVNNHDAGSKHTFGYEQVRYLARSKRYYLIGLVHDQFMFMQIDSLAGGSSQELISFLAEKCPNLKPKKYLSQLPGLIIQTLKWCLLVAVALLSILCIIAVNL